jgi:phosphohistidine phosphatase
MYLMSRELLLLRHGKSDWSSTADDFSRPLKDRGKRGAQRMGAHLHRQGLLPDYVLSSPAERALNTAEKAVKAMGLQANAVHTDDRVYAAGLITLQKVLADCPKTAKRVLLVGHNPGLEDLLIHLANKDIRIPADGKLMPTATLARLKLPDNWKKLKLGCGQLVSITRPDALPKQFPFPAPDGKEARQRPAYYYRQSSVIPYRLHEGEPQILIVSSSKNKHWVVPKGIHDPGLSAQASAAKEAWEEAGVEGRVHAKAIGRYQYEKWGATCTVEVYPMEVNKLLSESQWQEHHRGRKWVSAVQAAKLLGQDALRPMVLNLASRLLEK